MSLSLELITVYLLAVSTVVAALISQVVKPFVERIPALSPALPDQTLHDAVLRGANLLLTVAAVLGLAAIHGDLTLANAVPTAGAVLSVALGAHAVYAVVNKPSSAVAAAAAAPASASAPITLHQQSAPPVSAADASAI